MFLEEEIIMKIIALRTEYFVRERCISATGCLNIIYIGLQVPWAYEINYIGVG
jgi:hypothetical protein